MRPHLHRTRQRRHHGTTPMDRMQPRTRQRRHPRSRPHRPPRTIPTRPRKPPRRPRTTRNTPSIPQRRNRHNNHHEQTLLPTMRHLRRIRTQPHQRTHPRRPRRSPRRRPTHRQTARPHPRTTQPCATTACPGGGGGHHRPNPRSLTLNNPASDSALNANSAEGPQWQREGLGSSRNGSRQSPTCGAQ